jgi:uncharacterized protein (DUF934 family)
MALIIKNREVVEDDWVVITANEQGEFPLPEALPSGKIIVPLAYWKDVGAVLGATRGKTELAVWLAANDEPEEAVAAFGAIAFIGVHFPVFRDGRSISNARLLRERHGWTGEIRAIGDVQRDQIGYMARCGIDVFAVRADKNIHDALKAFDELSVHYQGAYDDPRPLFRRVQRGTNAPAAPAPEAGAAR